MKKFTLLLAIIVILLPFSADAQIYRWTDEEGVVHFTDDPSNVPAKYWEEERVKKEEVKPVSPETQSVPPIQPAAPPRGGKGDKAELYGDYPLEWWIDKFGGLRKEIADTNARLEQEKSFVTAFESGRRYGTIYSGDEISHYEGYKAEILLLEEKLVKLKQEVEEFQRKARIYGVPRNIRE